MDKQFIYFKKWEKPIIEKAEFSNGIDFGSTREVKGEWVCDNELVSKIKMDYTTSKFNHTTNEFDYLGDMIITLKNGESKKFHLISIETAKQWIESFQNKLHAITSNQ